MRRLLGWSGILGLTATALAACAPAPRPAEARSLRPWPPELVAPPRADSAAALERATPRERAILLVDLFDAARLLGDGASRELLWRCLERRRPDEGEAEPARGVAATLRALAALADRVQAAGLTRLAELLDQDREQLEGADPGPIASRRRDLGRDPDAAGHALLSRYGACAQALADAVDAPPWHRAAIANRCLIEHGKHDAPSYWSNDPSTRPPDPPWTMLYGGQRQLLEEARRRAPRLGPLLDRLSAGLDRFVETAERDGLAPPDIERLAPLLPAADSDLPAYDREPWVLLDREMAVIGRARFAPRDHVLVERIERALAQQRVGGARGRVALFVPLTAGSDAVDELAELARRGGADLLELVLTAPFAGGAAGSRRFVVLPLQLRPTAGRDLPRDLESRPPSLTLLVAPQGLSVYARDGRAELGPIADVAPRLAELRRAFPDEVQLAIAIDPTASYRDLVAAALAGLRAFHRLSLVDVPRMPYKDELAARLRRRAAARFELRGGSAITAARAIAMRGCYLDALDRDPSLAGQIHLLPGPPIALATGGPTDEELRRCLVHRAGALATRAPVDLLLAPR